MFGVISCFIKKKKKPFLCRQDGDTYGWAKTTKLKKTKVNTCTTN